MRVLSDFYIYFSFQMKKLHILPIFLFLSCFLSFISSVSLAQTKTQTIQLTTGLSNSDVHLEKIILANPDGQWSSDMTGAITITTDNNWKLTIDGWLSATQQPDYQTSQYSTIFWWQNNSITDWKTSSVLWWIQNTITNTITSSIFWWITNAISNAQSSLIFWWSWNTLLWSLNTILWWIQNFINGSTNTTIGWSNTAITWDNNTVFGSNIKVSGSNNLVWSDGSSQVTVNGSNRIILSGSNWVVINASSPAQGYALTVGGGMRVAPNNLSDSKIDDQSPQKDKIVWTIKSVQTWNLTCACAFDGSKRNSMEPDNMTCSVVCNTSFPVNGMCWVADHKTKINASQPINALLCVAGTQASRTPKTTYWWFTNAYTRTCNGKNWWNPSRECEICEIWYTRSGSINSCYPDPQGIKLCYYKPDNSFFSSNWWRKRLTICDTNPSATWYLGVPLSLPTPTLTGYIFSGRNTATNWNGTRYTDWSTFSGWDNLYAQRIAKTGQLIFDLQGGSWSWANPWNKTITYGNSYGSLPTNVTKPGYILSGWTTWPDCTWEPITASTIYRSTSNITAYACRQDNEWTVAVYDCNGNLLQTNTGTVNSTLWVNAWTLPGFTITYDAGSCPWASLPSQWFYTKSVTSWSITNKVSPQWSVTPSWPTASYHFNAWEDELRPNCSNTANVNITLQNISLSNYTFNGWYYNWVKVGNWWATYSTWLTSNITLTAQCSVNTYSLPLCNSKPKTSDATDVAGFVNAPSTPYRVPEGNGSCYSLGNFTLGQTLTSLPTPAINGYTFQWRFSAQNGWWTQYTTWSAYTAWLTLYAYFTPNTSNLNFDSQWWSTVTPKPTTYWQQIWNLTNPTRGWFLFDGRYTQANCAGQKYRTTTIKTRMGNRPLYACRQNNQWWLTVNYCDWTSDSFTGNNGDTRNITAKWHSPWTVTYNPNGWTVSPTSAQSSFSFVNWSTSPNNQWLSATNTAAITYTFHTWATIITENCSNSWNPVILPTPTRPDGWGYTYTFSGWYNESNSYVGTGWTSYTPSRDTTLHAERKASPITYTITYEVQCWTMSASHTYTVETATFTLPSPTGIPTWKVSSHWHTNPARTSATQTSITKWTTWNKTFYQKCEDQTYTLTLCNYLETTVTTTAWCPTMTNYYTISNTCTTTSITSWWTLNLPVSSVVWHTYNWTWNTNKWFTWQTYTSWQIYTGASDLTLYANIQPNTCTITLDPDGWTSATSSITATYGQSFNLPTEGITKPWYNFWGWYTSNNWWWIRICADNINTYTSCPTILYAHWTQSVLNINYCNGTTDSRWWETDTNTTIQWTDNRPTYTITYDLNWWLWVTPANATIQPAFTQRQVTNNTSPAGTRSQSLTNPTQVYTFKWWVDTATATCESWATLTGCPTATPVNSCFSFSGWYDWPTKICDAWWSSIAINSNKNLTAQRKPNTFTLSFNTTTTTCPSQPSINYTLNSWTIALPTPDCGADYTFDWWYTDAWFTNQVTSFTAGDHCANTTLYAKTTEKPKQGWTLTVIQCNGTSITYTGNVWETKTISLAGTKYSTVTFEPNWGTFTDPSIQFDVQNWKDVQIGFHYTFDHWTLSGWWEIHPQSTPTTSTSSGIDYAFSQTSATLTAICNPPQVKDSDFPTITKDCDTFAGWMYDSEILTPNTLYPLNNNITLYAQRLAKTWTVTYNLSWWTLNSSSWPITDTFTVGQPYYFLTGAIKTGSIFAGWYEKQNYVDSAKPAYTTFDCSSKNMGLYAKRETTPDCLWSTWDINIAGMLIDDCNIWAKKQNELWSGFNQQWRRVSDNSKQAQCEQGYHIPTLEEWKYVLAKLWTGSTMINGLSNINQADYQKMLDKLLLPMTTSGDKTLYSWMDWITTNLNPIQFLKTEKNVLLSGFNHPITQNDIRYVRCFKDVPVCQQPKEDVCKAFENETADADCRLPEINALIESILSSSPTGNWMQNILNLLDSNPHIGCVWPIWDGVFILDPTDEGGLQRTCGPNANWKIISCRIPADWKPTPTKFPNEIKENCKWEDRWWEPFTIEVTVHPIWRRTRIIICGGSHEMIWKTTIAIDGKSHMNVSHIGWPISDGWNLECDEWYNLDVNRQECIPDLTPKACPTQENMQVASPWTYIDNTSECSYSCADGWGADWAGWCSKKCEAPTYDCPVSKSDHYCSAPLGAGEVYRYDHTLEITIKDEDLTYYIPAISGAIWPVGNLATKRYSPIGLYACDYHCDTGYHRNKDTNSCESNERPCPAYPDTMTQAKPWDNNIGSIWSWNEFTGDWFPSEISVRYHINSSTDAKCQAMCVWETIQRWPPKSSSLDLSWGVRWYHFEKEKNQCVRNVVLCTAPSIPSWQWKWTWSVEMISGSLKAIQFWSGSYSGERYHPANAPTNTVTQHLSGWETACNFVCNESAGYYRDGTTCRTPHSKTLCNQTKPPNTIWRDNSKSTSDITETRPLPQVDWDNTSQFNTYTATDTANQCDYQCSDGYHREGYQCVSDIRYCYQSYTKPDNAYWNHGDNSEQKRREWGKTYWDRFPTQSGQDENCARTCDDWYHKEGASCISNIRYCQNVFTNRQAPSKVDDTNRKRKNTLVGNPTDSQRIAQQRMGDREDGSRWYINTGNCEAICNKTSINSNQEWRTDISQRLPAMQYTKYTYYNWSFREFDCHINSIGFCDDLTDWEVWVNANGTTSTEDDRKYYWIKENNPNIYSSPSYVSNKWDCQFKCKEHYTYNTISKHCEPDKKICNFPSIGAGYERTIWTPKDLWREVAQYYYRFQTPPWERQDGRTYPDFWSNTPNWFTTLKNSVANWPNYNPDTVTSAYSENTDPTVNNNPCSYKCKEGYHQWQWSSSELIWHCYDNNKPLGCPTLPSWKEYRTGAPTSAQKRNWATYEPSSFSSRPSLNENPYTKTPASTNPCAYKCASWFDPHGDDCVNNNIKASCPAGYDSKTLYSTNGVYWSTTSVAGASPVSPSQDRIDTNCICTNHSQKSSGGVCVNACPDKQKYTPTEPYSAWENVWPWSSIVKYKHVSPDIHFWKPATNGGYCQMTIRDSNQGASAVAKTAMWLPIAQNTFTYIASDPVITPARLSHTNAVANYLWTANPATTVCPTGYFSPSSSNWQSLLDLIRSETNSATPKYKENNTTNPTNSSTIAVSYPLMSMLLPWGVNPPSNSTAATNQMRIIYKTSDNKWMKISIGNTTLEYSIISPISSDTRTDNKVLRCFKNL